MNNYDTQEFEIIQKIYFSNNKLILLSRKLGLLFVRQERPMGSIELGKRTLKPQSSVASMTMSLTLNTIL